MSRADTAARVFVIAVPAVQWLNLMAPWRTSVWVGSWVIDPVCIVITLTCAVSVLHSTLRQKYRLHVTTGIPFPEAPEYWVRAVHRFGASE